MNMKKVILTLGYPPSRVWRQLYLSDINWFTVIPAKEGIQISKTNVKNPGPEDRAFGVRINHLFSFGNITKKVM